MGAKDKNSLLELLLKDSHIVQWATMGDLPYLDIVANGHKCFFNPTDAIRVAGLPG